MVLSAPQPHQPADENLNSRRRTVDSGADVCSEKKYELPRGAINLPRKKRGRASHSLSVGEPGAGFIFLRGIYVCPATHTTSKRGMHPAESVTPANTKAHKENHDRKNY